MIKLAISIVVIILTTAPAIACDQAPIRLLKDQVSAHKA